MVVKYFFSKDGDYLGGFEGEGALEKVPKDAIEVDAPPSHGLDRLVDGEVIPYIEPVDVLSELKLIFTGFPVETQAALGSFANNVLMFLQHGNPAAAKLVIQGAEIPPELEAVRTQMLSLFPE